MNGNTGTALGIFRYSRIIGPTDDETDDESLEATVLKVIIMLAVRVPDACPGTRSMSADRMLGVTKISTSKTWGKLGKLGLSDVHQKPVRAYIEDLKF